MSIEIKVSKRPISFKKAMRLLEKRVDEVKKNQNKELLWLLEHPITYTAGIRFNKDEIIDKKIKLVKTNRGGKITLHNPGQKIIYFVLNLNNRKKDIRNLITIIEKSIIEFLKIYKIQSKSDRNNIGVWVKKKKIAAIGIKIKSWIAYHGCSINIKNDISMYKKILPCGLDGSMITSMKDLDVKTSKNINNNLKRVFLKNLSKV